MTKNTHREPWKIVDGGDGTFDIETPDIYVSTQCRLRRRPPHRCRA